MGKYGRGDLYSSGKGRESRTRRGKLSDRVARGEKGALRKKKYS